MLEGKRSCAVKLFREVRSGNSAHNLSPIISTSPVSRAPLSSLNGAKRERLCASFILGTEDMGLPHTISHLIGEEGHRPRQPQPLKVIPYYREGQQVGFGGYPPQVAAAFAHTRMQVGMLQSSSTDIGRIETSVELCPMVR